MRTRKDFFFSKKNSIINRIDFIIKEKSVKKIISFILSITVCTTILGAEFKEITPLEDGKNVVIAQEKIVSEVEQEKTTQAIEEEQIQKQEIETPKERVEDLGIKRKGADGKVYAGNEKQAYTGKFALFLGDIIEYTETYVDGVLNGAKTWYSYDGKIVLEENYKNNRVEGEQKAYYENGNIKSIVTYKNGRIVGIEALAQDGKILHKSDLSKGTGVWKYFWENGKVLEEGKYKNWKKDGVWVKYRENGEVDVTTIYNNGRLVSQVWG